MAYQCVSVTLTLMLPYDKLPKDSALASAFDHTTFPAAKYIVSVGAICGLTSSALNSLFPIPRIMYAMASDGLIFRLFAKVTERTGTPAISCAVSGLFAALLAMFLELAALAEMMSLGTLLSYTIVSIGVVLLRFKPGFVTFNVENCRETVEKGSSKKGNGFTGNSEMVEDSKNSHSPSNNTTDNEKTPVLADVTRKTPNYCNELPKNISPSKNESKIIILGRIISCMIGGGSRLNRPTDDTYLAVEIALGVFVLGSIGLQSCVVWGMHRLVSKDPLVIVLITLFLVLMLLSTYIIARQPESETEQLYFKVPFLPFVPLTAVFVNIFLLLELKPLSWVRFAVWMVLGTSIVACHIISRT